MLLEFKDCFYQINFIILRFLYKYNNIPSCISKIHIQYVSFVYLPMAFHFNMRLQLRFSVSLTLLGISGIPRGISGIARRVVRRIQSDCPGISAFRWPRQVRWSNVLHVTYITVDRLKDIIKARLIKGI